MRCRNLDTYCKKKKQKKPKTQKYYIYSAKY